MSRAVGIVDVVDTDDPPHGASFDSFVTADPFTDAIHGASQGTPHARAAAQALDAGDPESAVEHALAATRVGVPAELVPHLATVHGIALQLLDRDEDALDLLGDAWRSHPDVASLPAALGAARSATGDSASAAHVMYAALVSDDPDESLRVHRRRLTHLLSRVRAK